MQQWSTHQGTDKRRRKIATVVLSAMALGLMTGFAFTVLETTNLEPEHQPHAMHGKPGSEIVRMQHSEFYLDIHEQKDITLSLQSPMSAGTLSVYIEADEGLMIASQQTEWQFELSPQQALTLPVTLYGASEGSHHLHIFTTYTDSYGQQTARAMAQQVDVGEGALVVNAYKSSAERQVEFVRLEAVEVVH